MLNANSYNPDPQIGDFQIQMSPYPASTDQMQFTNAGYVPNMVST